MIKKTIVYINSDRSVAPKEIKIANQFEIKTNEIRFIFDGDIPKEGYRYLILTNRKGTFYLPLYQDKIIFDSNETWIDGGWQAHIMISEAEIVDGVVIKSEKLFISDDFGLWVEPSDIDINNLKEQQLPTPLKLLYDDLLTLKSELRMLAQEGLKGDPGESAYEIAVGNGFEGSEELWLSTLKGVDGVNGKDGKDGRSVLYIEKTSSMGLIDTYTITYSDFTTSTFDVTNGASGGGGGGGGGGSSEYTVMTLTSNMEDTTFAIAYGEKCKLSINYSSLYNGVPTGKGNLKVSVNGVQKLSISINQGDNEIDITDYLAVGDNTINLLATDPYGTTRPLIFNVSTIRLIIESLFDQSIPYSYSGDLTFKFTPYGNVEKTIHFVVNGKEVDTLTTSLSGRQITHVLTGFSHGDYVLSVYATAVVDGDTITSPPLEYAICYVVEGFTNPIIASHYTIKSVKRGELVSIPFLVYDPLKLTADVIMKISTGDEIVSEQSVTADRTQKFWNTRNYPAGDVKFTIEYQTLKKEYTINVLENDINIEPEKNDLELELKSEGRSNDEQNPGIWTYNDITTKFTGMNWKSTGWMIDDSGDICLRLNGDARAEVQFKPFSRDSRQYGKTVELEFAIRDVNNRDAVVISCMNGGIGFEVKPDTAYLVSEQSKVYCNYKEEVRTKVAFAIESRNEYRMLSCYLNGVLSKTIQYPSTDNFQQNNPVNISVGSNGCGVDLYSIRSYTTALNSEEATRNFIADIQELSKKVETYEFNDIYDDFGNIMYQKAQEKNSVMTIVGDLPLSKGDKKRGYVKYKDLDHAELNFEDSMEIDVQGTSSQYFVRKNWKMKTTGPHYIDSDQLPAKVICIKADYAEATGTHNTQNAILVETLYSEKVPPQLVNPKVRTTIYGKPILLFHQKTENDTPVFYGKSNFNYDKGAEEVFGFTSEYDVECWEFCNNTSDACNFLGPIPDAWGDDFEARYPDKHKDISRFKQMHDWVVSTKGNVPKFKAEFENYFNLHYALIYYVYTFVTLMVDQRAKNMFLTYWAQTDKWYFYFYDNDTCFGINNEGQLVFDYYHEDTDIVDGANVYNGQNSTLWVNFRQAFADEIKETYQKLRSEGKLSLEVFKKHFIENGSNKWSESIYNEDANFKYIEPLKESNDATNLSQVRGTGEEHLLYFAANRINYCDSKWYTAQYADDYIALRIYTPSTWGGVAPNADITLTPYSNMYAGVRYKANGTLYQERAEHGVPVTFTAPDETFNDTETAIYGASQISSLGDLAPLYAGSINVSKASKLINLKVGDDSPDYRNNNLKELSVGTNRLLKSIDIRNCPSFTSSLGLAGCQNIEEIYATGSGITGVELADSGYLKIVQLPSTITNLTLKNQLYIEEFSMEGLDALKTLVIENTPAIDSLDIMDNASNLERVRLTGVEWNYPDASFLLELSERNIKGIDENGVNTDQMWLDGTCHVNDLIGAEMLRINTAFPYLKITYDSLESQLIYISPVKNSIKIDENGILTSLNRTTLDENGMLVIETTPMPYLDENGILTILDGDIWVEAYRETIKNGGDGSCPVASGKIEEPKLDGYEFTGWTFRQGDNADENALKNVEADRIVYASFRKISE